MRYVALASVLLTVFALVTPSLAENEQSKANRIERAMEAAPPGISRKATIAEADGTVLRPGSNGWRCLPTLGPGSNHPACNDEVWMRLMDAIHKHTDFKTDRIGISYMLAGDENVNNADPFDTTQEPGEVWVQEGPHLMIVVPDPKMLEGIPDDPNNGGPYVMWKGTPYAHIMVPIGPRQGK